MTVVRVALAQLNQTVGDLDGNVARILQAYDAAEEAGCDIVAFPELAVTGYPPEDLVLRPSFVIENEAAMERIAAHTGRCVAVVGFVDEDFDLFNAAAVCADGRVLGTYRKRLLPNYAVFDEARYFTPGDETDPLELYVIGGVNVGISVCEDIWSPDGPLAVQADGGAELAININASPYHRGKAGYRERMLADAARRTATRRSSTSTRSAVRTSWCSTAARSPSTPTARCSPAASSSSRTSSSSTCRSSPSIANACSTRAAARRSARCRPCSCRRRRSSRPSASTTR